MDDLARSVENPTIWTVLFHCSFSSEPPRETVPLAGKHRLEPKTKMEIPI